MGLPQANRLKNRQDFQRVYRRGIRLSSSHLILRALRETNDQSPPRIGISISQKVSKKAVVRNRFKRQIRAVMLKLLPHLSLGWKIAIVVRPSAQECKYEHFLQELKQLLKKAEIFNGY